MHVEHQCMRMRLVVSVALLLAALVLPGTPGGAQGRVFAEPAEGAPRMERDVFASGMQQLADRYPHLVEYTTVAEELGTEAARTSTGRDFQVATLTDRSVPDETKGYLLLTVAHGGEWCGLEAIPRIFEDLAIAWTDDPTATIDAGTGPDGDPLTMTVEELLRRVKVLFVEISPDGWMTGQSNADGFNTNRMASTIGWSLPEDPVIQGYGYATLTQPAGGAITTWLEQVRATELGGRPFAAAMDFHGPLPVGAMLLDTTPASVDAPARKLELSERITERTLEVLYGEDAGPVASPISEGLSDNAEVIRGIVEAHYGEVAGESEINKAAYLGARWNEYATAWESLDYDVPNAWGRFAGSSHSLGADSFSHEIPCNVQTPEAIRHLIPSPAEVQLYVDNVRAMTEVLLHHAAVRFDLDAGRYDVGGPVAFVDSPSRVTDADGNPVPPPTDFPGTAFHPRIEQAPYDVSQTDWFRDFAEVSAQPVVRLQPGTRHLGPVATVVVADHTDVDVDALRAFAEGGGNVVLTDGAVALAPELVDLGGEEVVAEHRAYVGYTDLVRDHPWAEGLYEAARQTYDPIPLGYPLLLERDQYWIACLVCTDGTGPATMTENSAPMWTVDRAAWEAAGGVVVGTADPPETPKDTHEGADTDRVVVGHTTLGEGRVVVYGAVLPTPSEDHDHWFGVAPYALTPLGQDLLLDALTWTHPALDETQAARLAELPDGGCVTTAPDDDVVVRLAGQTRIQTAVAMSQRSCGDGGAPAVVLARADDFPDGQVGAPLSVRSGAPLLLTGPDGLHPDTAAEIRRVLPAGGTVHLLGGTAALSPAVEGELRVLGYQVERLGGDDRFQTAAVVAGEGLADPPRLVVADGGSFVDTILAGSLAGGTFARDDLGEAVLLSDAASLPPATAEVLGRRGGAVEHRAVGAPAGEAIGDADALAGDDPVQLALEVARTTASPQLVGIATSREFPDMLAGSAFLHRVGGGRAVLLLTSGAALDGPVRSYLEAHADTIDRVAVFGGTDVISDALVEEVRSLVQR